MSVGKTYKIKSINYDYPMSNKLISMGLTTDTYFKFLGSSPLGNPMIISINNNKLAIRKEDLKCIII